MKHYTVTTYGCAEYLCHRGLIPGTIDRLRSILTVAHIQRAVSAHYQIHHKEMRSRRRAREVVRPRQVAMYLARNLTPKSLPEIGRLFGNRDHTTVIHAVRQVEKLCDTIPGFREEVKALGKELRL